MEFKLLHLLAFLAVAVVASEAAYSPELYWKAKLPNTPMPQAIRDILHPDLLEDKSTSVDVGEGGVDVDAGKGTPSGGTQVDVGKGGVDVDAGKGVPGGGTQVGVGKGGVGVSTGKPDRRTNVGVGKGGVVVRSPGKKGRPVYVGVTPGPNPFVYNYKASETQVHADPNVAKFFLENDLSKGKTMTLHFTPSTKLSAFLPRSIAVSMPLSSKNLPEAMSRFSVKPDSMEAEVMKNTIKECEEPGIKGEEKYCATSLESMVDYTKSKLGKNLQAISTEIKKETEMQKYKIKEDAKKVTGEEAKYVVCHKQRYPYAVFYCHKTQSTKAFVVPLKGEDGTEVKAVAVCHTNTSQWNPEHLAFRVLGVKPGAVPICHFLPQDHIVWYGN